ncbi:hypothetical protein BJF78_36205 [Pseudonocardia sp. CNS-139]|nr:hypothetical protein BJF78_36205 [Pseudonocardia sp. CNS-139]
MSAVEDPAQGGPEEGSQHRDPVAVLAGVLDQDPDGAATWSALATATASAEKAAVVRTPAELLADAAQLAATARTATWLDRLAADGVIAPADRQRIAAEDGAASLTRALRRAELAGRDPLAALVAAVADRPLDGARDVTNVIYSRIRDEHRLDPVGESWADWTPQVEDPQWQTYLDSLAAAADERAAQLGRQAATERPRWAVEAFGEVPEASGARSEWERNAGTVAAYRELCARDDDQPRGRASWAHPAAEAADVLGAAPKPGQVEAYAAYRAAWRALGRPEVDREVMELSDGQLRVRIAAAKREETWAPRYVDNELAGTRQAADSNRQTAALRAAEADAATDPSERARLQQEARDAAATAETLDRQAEALQQVDDARADWWMATAVTRSNAADAQAELAARHADDAEPEQLVTAEEWLAAARDADAVEDVHREVVDESEFTDAEHDADRATLPAPRRATVSEEETVLETGVDDVRAVAAREPRERDEDVVRVPAAGEVEAAVQRAQRAINEMRARQVADERAEAEERDQQLAQWHAKDTAGADDGRDAAAGEDVARYGDQYADA